MIKKTHHPLLHLSFLKKNMKRHVLLVVILFFSPFLSAADATMTPILKWDDALAHLRNDEKPPYTIIYVGHKDSYILRLIRSKRLDLAGSQLVNLSANEIVINPITNKKITGKDFIGLFAGVVQDYAAGTFFFLNPQGILLPHMVLPHNLHRNRPEVVELYAAFASSGMEGKMSIAEFGAANGRKEVANMLTMEIAGKKHVDFSSMLRSFKKDEPFLIATRPDGQSINPKVDPAIYCITKDPNGPAFIAQMADLWRKLTITTDTGVNPPPLVVIGPAGAFYPALDAMGIVYKRANATEQQLTELATPMVMIPGNDQHGAQGIIGFLPGEAVAVSLAVPVQDHTQINPDMPVSEVDWPAGIPASGN